MNVSASDLERHAYCPLSWSLAREGKTGRGKAIDEGRKKHAEIHNKVAQFKSKQNELKKALIIWSWWFTIIIIFTLDAIIFTNISETNSPIDVSKYLTMLSLIWLALGLLAIYLPWRKWTNFPMEEQKEIDEIRSLDNSAIPSALQP